MKRNQVLAKNFSGGANRAANMRFKAMIEAPKIKAPKFTNPPHFLHLQFTVDGDLCDEPCRPDEQVKGERDICTVVVKGGEEEKREDKECVKLASINAMRTIVQEMRDVSTTEFDANMKLMDALMEQFAPLQSYFDDVKAKRIEYNVKVAEIRTLAIKLRNMIKTLENNADSVEEMREKLQELKDMLAEMKANWVTPEADCTGLSNYFKGVEGDGLVAKYYNNLMFKGDPVERVEKQMKFFLSEEAPTPKINPNNWTATFEGFLRVPVTGEYTLFCEADDGCIVEIGTGPVINDNMRPASGDLIKYMKDGMDLAVKEGKWDDFIRVKTSRDPPRFPRTPKSEPLTFEGGVFNPIKIHTIHTVHNSLYETGIAFLQLSWESNQIKKEIIPSSYFYTKIVEESVSPLEYDTKLFKLDVLAEDDQAFIDSDAQIMKQTPMNFLGNWMFKTKSDQMEKGLFFKINKNIRMQVAQDRSQPNPMDSEWFDSNQDMAILKVESNIVDKLEMKEFTPAVEDTSMAMKYKDFPPGEIEVKTIVTSPMKIMFFINQVVPVPKPNCAGPEVSLTVPDYLEGCDDEGTAASNDCMEAFSKTDFWMAKDTPSIITVLFKVEVMPKKIKFTPTDKSKKPTMLKVFYNSKDYEELEVLGEDMQWGLEKPQATTKLMIEVDKGETGIRLSVFGSSCMDPIQEEKDEKKAELKKLGKTEPIRINGVGCGQSMDQMSLDQTIVECKELCKPVVDGKNTFERVGDTYTRKSSVCAAAIDFFKDQPLELAKKKFGVVKLPNKEDKAEFFFGFDQGLVASVPAFQKKEEVDVLDKEKCFMRGVVKSIDGGTLKVDVDGEEKTQMIDSVFKCGQKLNTPCGSAGTQDIKIKFCGGGGALDICKNKVKDFALFDVGGEASTAMSDGKFTQGWTDNAERTFTVAKFDQKNEKSVQEGSAALIDEEHKGEWFIKVPNGKYKMKFELKYLPGNKVAKELLKGTSIKLSLMVNKMEVKGEIKEQNDLLKLEIPEIEVLDEELRVHSKNLKIPISLLSLVISPFATPIEEGGKQEIKNAKTESFINCPTKDDVINCVQDQPKMVEVDCPGVFKQLDQDDAKEVACKMKCTDEIPGKPAGPNRELVDEPEPEEAEPKQPPFPNLEWWLGWDKETKAADSVIAFSDGTKWTLDGALAEVWGVEEGTYSYIDKHKKEDDDSSQEEEPSILKLYVLVPQDGGDPEEKQVVLEEKDSDTFESIENQVNEEELIVKKMSRKASEVQQVDGIRFAAEVENGAKHDPGDGAKILEKEEKKAAEEAAEAERQAINDAKGVPEKEDKEETEEKHVVDIINFQKNKEKEEAEKEEAEKDEGKEEAEKEEGKEEATDSTK